MQKKSIVLLITLFFISAISILILQNIKDTDKFLNNVAYNNSLSQILITMDNIKNDIPKFLKKNKNDIDEVLEYSSSVPFKVGDVELVLNITEYKLPPFRINELNTSVTSSEEFVNNINYKYDFLQLVNKNKKEYGGYSNNNQIKQTIDDYIKLTRDKDILKIQDDFTHINYKKGIKLIQCSYTIKVNQLNCEASFVLDLNHSTIKEFNIISIF
jgi:TusA-related sulfurtransferase